MTIDNVNGETTWVHFEIDEPGRDILARLGIDPVGVTSFTVKGGRPTTIEVEREARYEVDREGADR